MEDEDAGTKLMEGERILKALKPHPLAFWDMYLIWLWMIVLGLIFMSYGSELSRFVDNPLTIVSGYAEGYTRPSDNRMVRSIPFLSQITSSLHDGTIGVDRMARSYSAVYPSIPFTFASAANSGLGGYVSVMVCASLDMNSSLT